jgi:phosphoserine phosphatase
MNKLFVFDMDGTLLPGTTASLEIAKSTDTVEELQLLERRFAARELDTKMFAAEIHKLWGVLDNKVIRSAFEGATKMQRIDTVISVLAEQGHKSCVITMSPHFFAELFLEQGFDYVFASQFPRVKGEVLDLEGILTPEDKVHLTTKVCNELGIDIVDVVAFGDSMSDYPLFQTLVHTVSVNGTPELDRLAKYKYRGNDLYEIFELHNLQE